jgi:hypothetical protein
VKEKDFIDYLFSGNNNDFYYYEIGAGVFNIKRIEKNWVEISFDRKCNPVFCVFKKKLKLENVVLDKNKIRKMLKEDCEFTKENLLNAYSYRIDEEIKKIKQELLES